MTVSEVVSLLRAGGETVWVEFSVGPFELGCVVVHSGQLWHAEVPGTVGLAAYTLLKQVQSCRATFRGNSLPDRTVPPEHQPAIEPMDDKARRLMERARADGALAVGGGVEPTTSVGNMVLPPDAVPVASSGEYSLSTTSPEQRRALEEYEATFRRGTQAYLRHDFAAAKEAFEACLRLRPDDRRVLHNLDRLRNRTS